MSIVDSLKQLGEHAGEGVSGAADNSLSSAAVGDGVSGSSQPPPPTSSGGAWDAIYEAETFRGGMRAVFRVVPYWVPLAGVASGLGVYYVVFRVRLFFSKWRIAERQRAERKYDLLENLRGVSVGPVGAVEPLADDGDPDEEEEEDDDETAVSMGDVDEFRSSLGIRLPRDEDLLGIVEKMLMIDPIPDGWVLYRTTAGIIRFMNLNTQELFFFHPGKRKEKAFIEEELKRRNRQAMESKYSFSYEDEGLNSLSMSTRTNATRGSSHPGPSPLDFGDESIGAEEDETESSTFKRLFGYFLEKEQKKIEQDVAKSRSTAVQRASSVASSDNSPRAGTSPSNRGATFSSAQRTGTAGVGGAPGGAGGAAARQLPTSSTYRVVACSAIHGSRAGSVNN